MLLLFLLPLRWRAQIRVRNAWIADSDFCSTAQGWVRVGICTIWAAVYIFGEINDCGRMYDELTGDRDTMGRAIRANHTAAFSGSE